MKILYMLPILMIAGCASASPIDFIIPTIVPPMSEQLGYDIPDLGGVTSVGIVKSYLEVERVKLMALDSSAHITLKATESVVDGLLGLLASLGIGTAGIGIPVALRRLPRGAVCREDHDHAVHEAGKMSPEEFENSSKVSA